MGLLTISQVKESSATKLFNDICGFNKKNKLGLANPAKEAVEAWIKA